MATSALPPTASRGGSFLLEASSPSAVFTPADCSGDQRLIGQTAEEFVQKEVVPLIAELEEHKPGLMPQLVRKAAELGLMAGGIPEEFGGSGLDKVSATILSEKLAAYGSFAVTHGGHAGIGTVPLVYFGTEAQKKKYLPRMATAELISCYCLSEPQAGSDSLNSLTRAVLSPDGRHYILNGQKMWITNGGFADLFIVFAKVDGEKFTAFIVERGFPGFSVGLDEKKMGIKGSSTAPIFFDNCPVPVENVLHEIGRGHIVAFNTLNSGRFALGAYCMGGAKRVLEISSKYSRERTAFGKELREFGLISAKLAQMAIRIFSIESMVYRSAGLIDQAMASAPPSQKTAHSMKILEEYAIESSIAKVMGSEMIDFVVDEAVQIFGGYGYHEDYPVARAYRDSRVNRIFEGTNEINRLLIIQMLIKRSLSGSLPLVQAALKLADEVLAGSSPDSSSPDSDFAPEQRCVSNAKKIFLLAAGSAMQKFRDHLADPEHQSIVAALADVVMDVYSIESSLLRARKAAASPAQGSSSSLMADAARVLISDAMDRIEINARTALAAVLEGDALRTQLAVLRRFAKRDPVDTIALRRHVAQAVLLADRYPFEGR